MKKIFLKIRDNVLYQVIIFVVLMGIFGWSYVTLHTKLNYRLNTVENPWTWVYQVDSAKQENGKLVLNGFAFELERDSHEEKYEIVLVNADTQEKYYPEMTYQIREDVNKYFLCEYDYSQSGFEATIPLKELDLQDAVYEIYLKPESVSLEGFSMETYYANDELYFINPKEFRIPEATGAELKTILEEGSLRIYQPEQGTWVYQHNDAWYWVIDNEYYSEDWRVQVRVYTTQLDKLPSRILEAGQNRDNLSFLFSQKEIVDMRENKIRVAKIEIPKQYAVTKIRTGNGASWEKMFLPRYQFDNK